MSREGIKEKRNYYYVIDGSFRQKVDQGHPDAVRRDFETSDGAHGTKWERVVDTLTGYIEGVEFYDGDFGKQVVITLDEDEHGVKPSIQLTAASREGTDFLRKLPAMNLRREVCLRPYNFSDEGRNVRGIAVTQQDAEGKFKVKVGDFFYDAEKKENINGMLNPSKPRDDMDKEDWKIYFLQVDKFLAQYAREHMQAKIEEAKLDRETVTPKSAEQEQRMAQDYPQEDINPDDISF